MKTVGACVQLFAIPDRSLRSFAHVYYALLASIALLALCLTHASHEAELWGTLWYGCCVSTVWIGGGFVGRSLLHEAHASQMPFLARTVLSAWVRLAIVTLPGPALLLGLRGGDFIEIAGLLACFALAGLLFGSLQKRPPIALGYILPPLVYYGAVSPFLTYYHRVPGPAASLAWGVAALIGSLAVVRWFWLQGGKREEIPQAPMPFLQKKSSDSDAIRSVQSRWLSGFRFRTTVAHLKSHDPESAMRALLGFPFAPLNWQQGYVLLPLLMVTVSLFAAWMYWMFGTMNSLASNFPLMMSMYGIAFYFRQFLARLFGRRTGGSVFVPERACKEQLSELALLPGWDTPRKARRILLRAVLRPQLLMLLGVWMPAALLADRMDARTIAFPTMVCAVLGISMALVAFSLRALARLPMSFFSMASFFACIAAGSATEPALLAALKTPGHESSEEAFLVSATAMIAWLVASILTGVLARDAYRRYAAMPHPFLET